MAQKGIALREWSLSASDYETEQEFRYAVKEELAAFEHTGERLGIGIVAAPIRTRVGPNGSWFTAAWIFKTATIPAARPEQEIEQLEDALAGAAALVEDPDALAEVE